MLDREGRRKAALIFSRHTWDMHVLAVALVAVHGLVMQGPTKPVCQVGVPCSKPAANVLLRFTHAGSYFTIRTDARGRYAVKLARGTYTVEVVPPRTIGTGIKPRTFFVHGTTQRRDFELDTGIR
jgi:hypothetical protein